MKTFLPIALLAALAVAPTAHAATYKITSATHTSSSSKAEEGYTGTSTAGWKLAKASKMQVNYGPGYVISGMGRVNVTGSYGVDITTDWPGRCNWTTSTGDTSDYRSQAPAPFDLVVGVDPRNARRTVVGHTGVQASLGNGYLGTECSTSLSGEPDRDTTQLKSVPLNTFKKKKVTLTFSGATSKDGIAFAWSTKFVLKRVRR